MTEIVAGAVAGLPCPPGVSEVHLPAVLAYWPAWRVTEWARVEIGSRILVVGSGEFAGQVAQLCRCRGALWRAVWGSGHPSEDFEYLVPLRSGQRAHHVLSALPARPDSVVVLDRAADVLQTSLELCRDGGTVVIAVTPATGIDLNLYPDVHRRELSVRVGSPLECGSADSEAWRRAARRIDALVRLGVLASQSAATRGEGALRQPE